MRKQANGLENKLKDMHLSCLLVGCAQTCLSLQEKTDQGPGCLLLSGLRPKAVYLAESEST